jgi:hypothetical protein
VYAFCFEGRQKGMKDPVIMREANRLFGRTVVSDPKYVWIYASRHAKRHGLDLRPKWDC